MGDNQAEKPRKESIAFFEKAIPRHDKVVQLKKLEEQVYEITRLTGGKVVVYLTNLYTVGLADYYDIRERHPEVNCIVTISNWNSYTRQAKEQANSDHFGLFVFEEFMGALNVEQQWKYVKKDSKGKPESFWR